MKGRDADKSHVDGRTRAAAVRKRLAMTHLMMMVMMLPHGAPLSDCLTGCLAAELVCTAMKLRAAPAISRYGSVGRNRGSYEPIGSRPLH